MERGGKRGGEPQRWQEAVPSFSGPALEAGEAYGWFDPLYAAGADGTITMPWDQGGADPLLVSWTADLSAPQGSRAVVVGCGLGEDAELMAALGFATVAFDVSPTAVRIARERHPGTAVDYRVADLFALPQAWAGAFDLVVEIFLIQALPPKLHARASRVVAGLVTEGGTLLSIGSTTDRGGDPPPWPLTPGELEALTAEGLTMVADEELPVPGPPHRQRRTVFERPTASAARVE